jgi:ADP-ribose pyrophosphatase
MHTDSGRLLWAPQSREKIAACGIFDLTRTKWKAADGRSGDFTVLEAPDWVNVVPVIRGGGGGERFLMVRQFRHGAGVITTEFPAGLVNRGETPLEAARRELTEETGFRAGKMTLLGSVRPNPAFMNNLCYTFLAENMSSGGVQSLDRLEILEVTEVAASELRHRAGTGEYVNALVMVALLWYNLHGTAEQ